MVILGWFLEQIWPAGTGSLQCLMWILPEQCGFFLRSVEEVGLILQCPKQGKCKLFHAVKVYSTLQHRSLIFQFPEHY